MSCITSIRSLVSSFNRLSFVANKCNIGVPKYINHEVYNRRNHKNFSNMASISNIDHGIGNNESLFTSGHPTCFSTLFLNQKRHLTLSPVLPRSLLRIHLKGPLIRRKAKNPIEGKPMAKGIVLKVLSKKPKKPNSANRKCVLVRLSTGREMVAYIPGEGHNLQEHNTVLVEVARLQDVPGVKITCIRGAYDLNHVVKKKA